MKIELNNDGIVNVQDGENLLKYDMASLYDIKRFINLFFKVNEYGKTYIDALYQSDAEYGMDGIKTQVLYILCNAKAQGPDGKIAKKILLKWANCRGGN